MINNSDSSRSWFCVLNNPQNIFGNIEPDEMVDRAIELWVNGKPQRSCAVNYEIGDSGTPHMHMVLEDPSKTRFSAVQKIYSGIHIEKTRGTKEDAMNYILKKERFEEKKHTVVVQARFWGEIKANKGCRKDLDIIQELIDQGKTPNEIMDISINYRRYEPLIRKHFFRLKEKNTPKKREITVYWHVGETGCGKSYTYVQLCNQHGSDNVFLMNDYENGGFDNYCGESILFMDEFKGNLRFQTLLNYLDVYPVQIHCRFCNATALWKEVHITSCYYPEETYKNMVTDESRRRDRVEQLLRRIDYIYVHYRENDEYKVNIIPQDKYMGFEKTITDMNNRFIPCQIELPFPEWRDSNR